MSETLKAALNRFNARFGQPVAGRSLYDFSSVDLVRWIDESVASGLIDSRLVGADTCLVDWTEIISAADDCVEMELICWAGLDDAWTRCEERWARRGKEFDLDFMSDVAEGCESLFINGEEYDGGAPGRSGIWYTIETSSLEQSKRDLRGRFAEVLIELRKSLWKKKPKREKPVASTRPELPDDARFFIANGIPIARVVKRYKQWGSICFTAYDVPGGRPISDEELAGKLEIDRAQFIDLCLKSKSQGLH